MRQFVSQQMPPTIAGRGILTFREGDVPADGVGTRTDALRRPGVAAVGVYSHLREIPAEARLEKGTGLRVEGLAGRAQNLGHDRRRLGTRRLMAVTLFGPERLALFLFLARGAFALQRYAVGPWRRGVHTHHLVGDAIRLMFKGIVGLPDNQLRLHCGWERLCSQRR
jgi:hypothetical protein